MVDNLPSRSELAKEYEVLDEVEVIQRGKALRDKGYRLHWHPINGHSVEIPSGEQLRETQINVMYRDTEHKEEFQNALRYLVLCETRLCKISGLSFSLS